ncbi:putative glycosyltransferase STELLO1 [Nymphon striatum]|nr:putative glycosyltransferase STELLO1 [Nymphon striatum]
MISYLRKFLPNLAEITEPLQRMMLRLQKYRIDIEYRKGKHMYISDHLSRSPLPDNPKHEQTEYDIFKLQEQELIKEIEEINPDYYHNVTDSTLKIIMKTTAEDVQLNTLADVTKYGWPEDKTEVPLTIREYWPYRDELTVHNCIIYRGTRVVIPTILRREIGNGTAEAAVKQAKKIFKLCEDPYLAILQFRDVPDDLASPNEKFISKRTRSILPTNTNLLDPKRQNYSRRENSNLLLLQKLSILFFFHLYISYIISYIPLIKYKVDVVGADCLVFYVCPFDVWRYLFVCKGARNLKILLHSLHRINLVFSILFLLHTTGMQNFMIIASFVLEILGGAESPLLLAQSTSKKPDMNRVKLDSNQDSTTKIVIIFRVIYHGSTFLDIRRQNSLGYKILNNIPSDGHSRINIGYLYAIQVGLNVIYHSHGAKQIFEIESSHLENANAIFNDYINEQRYVALVIKTKGIFNPYSHFTSSNILPMITPKESSPNKPRKYDIYLTRAGNGINNFDFDRVAPPVVIPEGVFAGAFHNTMFHHNSFWSLLLLGSMSENLSYIWRGYVSQKLLLLFDWKCPEASLFLCFERLMETLYLKNLVDDTDVKIAKAWMEDLHNICYNPPVLQKSSDKIIKESVTFYPTQADKKDIVHDLPYLKTLCPNMNFPSEPKVKPFPMFPDILLIVVYNHPDAINLKIISALYRSQFPNMLICGYENSDVKYAENEKLSYFPTSIYRYINTSSVHECLKNVALVDFKVKGYLVIQDDVILNYWNVVGYNRDNIWSTFDWRYFNSFADASLDRDINIKGELLTQSTDSWIYPKDNIPKLLKTFDKMRKSTSRDVRNCHSSLITRLRGDFRFDFGQCDIFYLPKRLWNKFSDVIQVFIDSDVFIEISCPTTLRCIEHPSRHQELEFSHFNIFAVPPKHLVWKHYKSLTTRPYVHPYKFNAIIKGEKERIESFCSNLLPEFLHHN